MERGMNRRDLVFLALCALFWGTSFLFIKIAVRTLPTFTLVELRLALAAIFMLAYIRWSGQRLPPLGRAWLPYLILGATNCAIPYLLIAWGERTIDSGLTAILHASMPLVTLLMACFITRTERMTSRKMAGISLGLVGVMLLIGPAALQGLGIDILAQLAVILAAVNYAWAAVYGAGLPDQSADVLTAGQMVAAAVLLLPFVFLDYPWAFQFSWTPLLAMICLAVFGTAVPYVLYFRLIATAGATRASLVTYLLPVVGAVFGIVVLHEELRLSAMAALLLILAGVAAVNGR